MQELRYLSRRESGVIESGQKSEERSRMKYLLLDFAVNISLANVEIHTVCGHKRN